MQEGHREQETKKQLVKQKSLMTQLADGIRGEVCIGELGGGGGAFWKDRWRKRELKLS